MGRAYVEKTEFVVVNKLVPKTRNSYAKTRRLQRDGCVAVPSSGLECLHTTARDAWNQLIDSSSDCGR